QPHDSGRCCSAGKTRQECLPMGRMERVSLPRPCLRDTIRKHEQKVTRCQWREGVRVHTWIDDPEECPAGQGTRLPGATQNLNPGERLSGVAARQRPLMAGEERDGSHETASCRKLVLQQIIQDCQKFPWPEVFARRVNQHVVAEKLNRLRSRIAMSGHID